MITNNLSTLKINKLTQAQYDRALSEGRINDNELYLTPDNSSIDIDLSDYVDLTSDQSINGVKSFSRLAAPIGSGITFNAKDNYKFMLYGDGASQLLYTQITTSASTNLYRKFMDGEGALYSVNEKVATKSDIDALNSKFLHNFTITLSHQTQGNPRESKFLTVDYSSYTSNYATYIKLSAASCHGNGSSYQFLEDILIGVSANGSSITCNVIKYCQSPVDSSRSNGDVFYVFDSTNKKVYFYILGGQWASTLFTPYTVIGSATGAGVTQHSGNAEYYSTGDKVMAQGNNSLLFNCVDTASDQTISGDKSFTGSASFSGPVGNTQSTAGVYLGLDSNSTPNANIAITSANNAAYIDMGIPNSDYGFRIIKWNNENGKYDAELQYGADGGGSGAIITVPRKTGTLAVVSYSNGVLTIN